MKVHQCRENEAHAYSAATSALHSAHIFPPLLCRCDPADSKSKGELCEVSPLLLVLLTGNKPLAFLYTYMCCGCDWFTQIVVEEFLLFSKIYLDS